MPIYEYKCTDCGRLEVEQSIKDEPLGSCPKCGEKVQRLISRNVNIIFKGPGFYINDSRSNGSAGSQDTSSSEV